MDAREPGRITWAGDKRGPSHDGCVKSAVHTVHFIKSTDVQSRTAANSVLVAVKASDLAHARRKVAALIKRIGRGMRRGSRVDRLEGQARYDINISVVERRIYESINGLRVNDSRGIREWR